MCHKLMVFKSQRLHGTLNCLSQMNKKKKLWRVRLQQSWRRWDIFPLIERDVEEKCQTMSKSYCACYQFKLFPRVTQPSSKHRTAHSQVTHTSDNQHLKRGQNKVTRNCFNIQEFYDTSWTLSAAFLNSSDWFNGIISSVTNDTCTKLKS